MGQQCQEALKTIKTYLTKPLQFWAISIKGKPLVLYIATIDQSLRPLLAKKMLRVRRMPYTTSFKL